MAIHTVTGTCRPEDLGITLMHEHLLIGWPGWEADTAAPRSVRQDMVKLCVDKLEELKTLGLRSLVDPCPIDLGRDVELAAAVAQATGVNIICATGLYKEDQGGAPYFKFRAQFSDIVAEMTEIFVRELTVGIGDTGIRAGVIKVATGADAITPYEANILRAAARAAKETGAPIMTHTDEGALGREQLALLSEEGVDPRRVLIGHCCGGTDLRRHIDMLDQGCTLGFDRFGIEIIHPDKLRLAALIGLLGVGYEKQLIMSHDTVWCWRGRSLPLATALMPNWQPTHVFENIIPQLRAAGVSQAKIDTMLIDNPRRFFAV